MNALRCHSLFRCCSAALLLGLGSAFAAVVQAAEITASPLLELSSGYESNVNLDDDDPVASARARALGAVTLAVDTLENHFDLSVSVDHRYVAELANFTGTTYNYAFGWSQQRDRVQLGFNVAFLDAATPNTDINEFGEIVDGQRQQVLTPNASIIYSLNDRLTASISGGLTNSVIVRDTSGLQDFRQPFARLAVGWEATERLRFTPSIDWRRFATENEPPVDFFLDANTTETTTLRLGAERDFGESTTVSANIGARRSKIRSAQLIAVPPFLITLDETETALVFGGGLVHQFEHWRLDFNVLREIQPTVVGLAIESDNYALRASRSLDERSRFSLDAQFTRTDNLSGVVSTINRERLRVTARYTYDLSPRWQIGGIVQGLGLRFTDAAISDTESARSSAAVGLELRYAANGLPLGR